MLHLKIEELGLVLIQVYYTHKVYYTHTINFGEKSPKYSAEIY